MSARSDGTVKITVIGNNTRASGMFALFHQNEITVMNKTIPVSSQLTRKISILNVFVRGERRRSNNTVRLGTDVVPLKLLVVAKSSKVGEKLLAKSTGASRRIGNVTFVKWSTAMKTVANAYESQGNPYAAS